MTTSSDYFNYLHQYSGDRHSRRSRKPPHGVATLGFAIVLCTDSRPKEMGAVLVNVALKLIIATCLHGTCKQPRNSRCR